MTNEEKTEEIKENRKKIYRIIIDRGEEDCDTIEEVCQYLKENFTDLSFCNIRPIYEDSIMARGFEFRYKDGKRDK